MNRRILLIFMIALLFAFLGYTYSVDVERISLQEQIDELEAKLISETQRAEHFQDEATTLANILNGLNSKNYLDIDRKFNVIIQKLGELGGE